MIFMIKAIILVATAGLTILNQDEYKHENTWHETKDYVWQYVIPMVMSV